MKKTKLTEKPSSILDIAEENISQKFREYIEEISQLNTRTCKGSKIFYSV